MKHLKEIMMKDSAIALPALAYFARMHKRKVSKKLNRQIVFNRLRRIGDESKIKVNDLETSPSTYNEVAA